MSYASRLTEIATEVRFAGDALDRISVPAQTIITYAVR